MGIKFETLGEKFDADTMNKWVQDLKTGRRPSVEMQCQVQAAGKCPDSEVNCSKCPLAISQAESFRKLVTTLGFGYRFNFNYYNYANTCFSEFITGENYEYPFGYRRLILRNERKPNTNIGWVWLGIRSA